MQSYALCKVLNDKNYDAKQIQYKYYSKKKTKKTLVKKDFKYYCKAIVLRFKWRYISKMSQNRFTEFDEFRKSIPHTESVFTDDNISETLDEFDSFIVGSDQVWNPHLNAPSYLLSFANNGKKGIAYGASLGVTSLTSEQKGYFKKYLTNFSAISVREKDAVSIIQKLTNIGVQWVLDPVFLLSKNDWITLASNNRIQHRYIFTYFLGEDKKQREIVKRFAQRKKLKIVSLPHILNYYNDADSGFGDIRIYNASPKDFLSLIKNAEYVFTDSFHAVAFSTIFNKEFFVFSRGDMNSRIESITSVFGLEKRYIKQIDAINDFFFEKITPADYSQNQKEFDELKKLSLDFLFKSLNDGAKA